MSNLRKVNDDILKDWLDFREDVISSLTCAEAKKHFIYFEEIAKKILRNVPAQNKKYVEKQLKQLKVVKTITFHLKVQIFHF